MHHAPCRRRDYPPILCLSRNKIAEYLKEKKISHIQDSTNLSDEYTRNRIRHHILPILEQQVNGKAAAHMAETAARISQAEEYLTQQSCRVLGEFQKGKEYYFTENFLWSSDHSGLCITTGDGTAGRQTEGSGGCSL